MSHWNDYMTKSIELYCSQMSIIYFCMVNNPNISRPVQNGLYVSDDIFKYLFLKERCMLTQMSLNVVPNGSTDNRLAY